MHCDQCGFTYGSIPDDEIVDAVRGVGPRFAAELTDASDAAVRTRPAPETWSALEYACHMRDVLLVMRERVLWMLREPGPSFTTMGRDERVLHDRYNEQAPDDVARQITDAAAMLAFVFDGLTPDQWGLTCVYWYPEREDRTLDWVAQHTMHEAEHHLQDLRSSLTRSVGAVPDQIEPLGTTSSRLT